MADAAAIAPVRWELYRLLADHCAAEDHAVFHPLFASGEARLMAFALQLRNEIGPLMRQFRSSNADWPIDRINRDWRGYVIVMQDLLDRLDMHLWFEAHLLLPVLGERLERRAA